MINRRNEAKVERQQQRLDSGFMEKHFPEVASIVIRMMYNQKGIKKDSLLRTVNFFPGSYAFFKVDCLSRDCVGGGFDLTQVITAMIKNRREASTGELSCEGDSTPAGHSSITYEVGIRYS